MSSATIDTSFPIAGNDYTDGYDREMRVSKLFFMASKGDLEGIKRMGKRLAASEPQISVSLKKIELLLI